MMRATLLLTTINFHILCHSARKLVDPIPEGMAWEGAPKTVADAWFRHNYYFERGDLNGMLRGFNNQSEALVFRSESTQVKHYPGLDGIRAIFTELFVNIYEWSTFTVHSLIVDEDPKHVFLVWSCSGVGYELAADVIVFDDDYRIRKQVAIQRWSKELEETAGDSLALAAAHPAAAHLPMSMQQVGKLRSRTRHDSERGFGSVQETWDNHNAGRKAEDLEQIMLGFTDDSIVNVFTYSTLKDQHYIGKPEIREFYTCLMSSVSMSNVTQQAEKVLEKPASVYAIWFAPGSDYSKVMDTMLFNDAHAIIRQYLVIV